MRLSPTLLLIPLALLLSGCQSTFGPGAVTQTHPAYNQAIVDVIDQQMLLNLVRLKYRDSTYFLDVSSVTASLTMEVSAGIEGELSTGNGPDVWTPEGGVSYSQRPTISYTPLRGEDLVKNVLSPLSLEALLVMTQSGWSSEQVLGLCIERINGLDNAIAASGPTPKHEPDYEEFVRFLALLEGLQLAGLVEIGRDDSAAGAGGLFVRIDMDEGHEKDVEELKTLLGLSPDSGRFRITGNFLEEGGEVWVVRSRSLVSVLFYLSQNVEVPEAHRKAGLITVTKNREGGVFDWGLTPAGAVFQIRVSRERPDGAFVTVPYRGHWFYIADNDLESKSTFMLLQQLFKLQAGAAETQAPTLTIPVGG